MKPQRSSDGERTLAVFFDFENVGLGFGNRRDRFSIERVLERLVEKGKIVAKKAYADWSRFSQYASAFHSAAVELVEIPKRSQTGKNSADIRMCVDAMDLAYSKDHIDTFVIVSGDSDFSPLVSKLKELGKHVIGLGLADSTSELLRDNCDEFIYYEDLGTHHASVQSPDIPTQKQKAFGLLFDALLALRRENKEVIYSSMIKDTIKRKKPSFNEEYFGYRTFSELLEDAQRHSLIELDRHKTSGTYIVTNFSDHTKAAKPNPTPAKPSQPERPAATSATTPTPQKNRPRQPKAESPPPKPPTTVDPKPPTKPANQNPEPLPLGRALFDEIDDWLDDIPSYGPRRPTVGTQGNNADKEPAGKQRQQPAGKNGHGRKPTEKRDQPAKAEKSKPKPPHVEEKKPTPKPKQAANPQANQNVGPDKASDPGPDEEFGAGLNL